MTSMQWKGAIEQTTPNGEQLTRFKIYLIEMAHEWQWQWRWRRSRGPDPYPIFIVSQEQFI